VQVNADVYYIRWSNVQQLIQPDLWISADAECRQCRVVRARVGDHREADSGIDAEYQRRLYPSEADERECHVDGGRSRAGGRNADSEHPEIHREHGADLPEAVQR